MSRPGHVIVLVGPKGAGKSRIGELLATELGVRFVRAEPLFMAAAAEFKGAPRQAERLGFESLLACLREGLAGGNVVCFESTGASARFAWLARALADFARVHFVRVMAAPETCLRRVRWRDASAHLAVSARQLHRINERSRQVRLPWAAEIDNEREFCAPAILGVIGPLLARPSMAP